MRVAAHITNAAPHGVAGGPIPRTVHAIIFVALHGLAATSISRAARQGSIGIGGSGLTGRRDGNRGFTSSKDASSSKSADKAAINDNRSSGNEGVNSSKSAGKAAINSNRSAGNKGASSKSNGNNGNNSGDANGNKDASRGSTSRADHGFNSRGGVNSGCKDASSAAGTIFAGAAGRVDDGDVLGPFSEFSKSVPGTLQT